MKTEIAWDSYGVPHIHANDDLALFRAFGWAQMAAFGGTILQLFAAARANAAKTWGEAWVQSDWWAESLGISRRAEQWWDQQPNSFAACLEAFATGMNDHAAAHPELLGPEHRRQLPVRAIDLIAHAHRILTMEFVLNPLLDPAAAVRRPGSNAFALAPVRSRSGNAMLFAGPHLAWTDALRWFEVHLVRPGLAFYGATLVGFPVPVVGFNQTLGWTHTANAQSAATLYQLESTAAGYRLDDDDLPFCTRDARILIRRGETLVQKRWTIRESRHGLVLPLPGRRLALRVAGLDRPHMLHQWWRMACAPDLAQFEAALEMTQLPALSVIYADAAGHILYSFGGLVPAWPGGVAPPSDRPAPGGTTDTLWSDVHGYRDLPRLVDPNSGWVHNANDPPWNATVGDDAPKRTDFPSYMAPEGPLSLRAQFSARTLRDAQPIDFDAMMHIGLSQRAEIADRVLEPLLTASRRRPGEVMRRAEAVLAAWDRTMAAESRGAALFAAWLDRMPSQLFAQPWIRDAPLDTPCGLADPDAAAAALEVACTELEARFGSADVPWGKTAVMAPAGVATEASGGDVDLGVFCELWFDPPHDGRRLARGGSGFFLGVEFSDPPRAQALNLGENADSRRESGPRPSQAQVYNRRALRRVLLARDEIAADSVFVEHV